MARDRLAALRAQQHESHTRGSTPMQTEITRPQSMPVRNGAFYPPYPPEGGGYRRTMYEPYEMSRVQDGYADTYRQPNGMPQAQDSYTSTHRRPYDMLPLQGRHPNIDRQPYEISQGQGRYPNISRQPYEISQGQGRYPNHGRQPHGLSQVQDRYPDSNHQPYEMLQPRSTYTNTSRQPYEIPEVQANYTNTQRHSDTSAFYSEISSIQDGLRTFNDNVSRISDLHSRSLNNVDGMASQQQARQLDELVQETSKLGKHLKIRIKALQKKVGGGRDEEVRKQQTGLVRQRFMEAIHNYQRVEQQYRSKYKKRIERQIKTIKPDVTPEEVKEVLNGEDGVQIFAQALQSSNRYGESRAVFREVKERHEDIKRIERTLGELARLFNDMSLIIEEHDEEYDTMVARATDIEKRAEIALQQTKKAVSSARALRKRRWTCIVLIVVLILTIIGTIIGVVVSTMNNNNNNNSW